MQHVSSDRIQRLGSDEGAPPRSRLRRVAVVAAWLLAPILGFGFLAVRSALWAEKVEAVLDARIVTLREEIASARDAEERLPEIAASLAGHAAERDELDRRLPCEMDLETLLPDVKARMEPLGVQVRTELGFVRRNEAYTEAAIPIVLPGAEIEAPVRAALAGSERLLALSPYTEHELARLVIAFQWPDCPREAPPLPAHRQPISRRNRLDWPFDRGIVQRELALEGLRAEREQHAKALQTLRYDAILAENNRRRHALLAELELRWAAKDLKPAP